MEYILIILTTVAMSGQGSGNYQQNVVKDWRPIGVFASKELCDAAAQTMIRGMADYKCLRSK